MFHGKKFNSKTADISNMSSRNFDQDWARAINESLRTLTDDQRLMLSEPDDIRLRRAFELDEKLQCDEALRVAAEAEMYERVERDYIEKAIAEADEMAKRAKRESIEKAIAEADEMAKRAERESIDRAIAEADEMEAYYQANPCARIEELTREFEALGGAANMHGTPVVAPPLRQHVEQPKLPATAPPLRQHVRHSELPAARDRRLFLEAILEVRIRHAIEFECKHGKNTKY